MASARDRERRRKGRGDRKDLDESILHKYASVGVSLISDDSPKGLDPTLRHEMESVIGAELSDIRVHTGEKAGRMAEALGARAFAAGPKDVFFARGEYEPGTTAGKALLAHELTHVAEGRAGLSRRPRHPEREEMEIRARRAEEMVLAEEQAPGAPKETEMLEPVEVEPPPVTDPEKAAGPVAVLIDKTVLEERIYNVIERESRREHDRTGRG